MTWHNCDGKIGKLLRYASRPKPRWFNKGKPTWFIRLAGGQRLPVVYCPICGEELPELKETACVSGHRMSPACSGCKNVRGKG